VTVAVDWNVSGLRLRAIEPTEAEVAAAAERLARAYNDPRNAELLGHTELLDADDVIDHYAELAGEGARQFLLYVDGALAGDADLRGIEGGTAEFAFLIGDPIAQGRGLGTRFAVMIHAFGFATLDLDVIYASVVPENVASRRVFEKLGYRADDSPRARHYADAPGDVTLSIDRATFAAAHATALAAIDVAERWTCEDE
jgi:RimJ/RimL family protein N-acetyltransferase